MQQIKYQLLNNNDDDLLVPEFNSDQNKFVFCVQECKRHHWLFKVLFICFVVVKAIYIINIFKSHNVSVLNYNQTDIFFYENTTNRNGEILEKIEKKFLTTALPYDNSKHVGDIQFTTNAINYANTSTKTTTTTTTTVAAYTNYNLKNLTKMIYVDAATKHNNIEDNHYGNVNFQSTTTATTATKIIKNKFIIDSKNNLKAKTINLNSENITKTTTVEKLTTAIYLNKKLLNITETITDPQKISTTPITTTTTLKHINESPVKTPAAKSLLSTKVKKYFINTSHCHIPFVEPFSQEIRKIFKPQHYTGCTKDQPIVTVSFDQVEARYYLHINYTVAESLKKRTKKNSKPIEDDVLCCYRQIVRSGSGSNVDASFKLLPCTNFHQDFAVPIDINGIIVNCKSISQSSTLQEDAFSFVQIDRTLMQRNSKNITLDRQKPSILMIGIDSLSRINFRRNMPETFKYLLDNKWYELMGYNKVGDNTLPNLMPLLTGYTRKTVYDKCHPKNVGGFDNCNFIWNTFKNNGYHTAYAEDSSSITTFNYHLKGFKKPPTDYYFRPIALAIEKSMKRKTKAGLNYCVGRKQFGEYIYDYGTEFVTRYKNLSTFGFFWTNSFSHNSFDIAATMDKTMVKYFKEWQRRGIFDNSVVIFFSDHGVRWGPLLKLPQGFLEERLPMFFISLPKWFSQVYPQLVKNLETNQKRLTNPFDIHMTLQHLLQLSEPTYKIQPAFDCPKCQSIFKEIPENRTCDDASIPEAWCTCLQFKKESTKSKTVETVAKLVIQEMNHYFDRKNLTSLCSPLQLKEITNAKSHHPEESESSKNLTIYTIEFITDPVTEPKALFSATIDYDEQNKFLMHLNVEDISRQSLYENTAKCTDDKQAKKYCICKNSLKLTTN